MTWLAATPAVLPDDLEDAAIRVEAALERGGGRGMSPAAAAREARIPTSQAATVLAWLVGHQHANTRTCDRFYAGARKTDWKDTK